MQPLARKLGEPNRSTCRQCASTAVTIVVSVIAGYGIGVVGGFASMVDVVTP